MEVKKINDKTRAFWEKAKNGIKFQADGLFGLKSIDGDILLEPIYDKIEFCSDFIYVHYGQRHKYYYNYGGTRDCPDDEDDGRFYENGRIGLRDQEGRVLLKAKYDEIIDWGKDCDVIYTRIGSKFHYYNHNLEEILTQVENIPEDEYPNCPYNLGEDQNRGVLLCVEPIEKRERDCDCFACGQWVRLSRIPYKKIEDIFKKCMIKEMPQEAIDDFMDDNTYIYSARECISDGDNPISSGLKKLETLDCYDSSWSYLVKISVNHNTKIDPYDLYGAICFYENLESCISFCIAIDYDDNLRDGAVHIFQVHYFWDDMGAFLNDAFKQNFLPNRTVSDIKWALNEMTDEERKFQLSDVFWWIKYSEDRDWEETEKVLDYLKSIGGKDVSMLLRVHLGINPYWIEEISPKKWDFKKHIVEWAIANGAQLNSIHKGMSGFDEFVENLDESKEIKKDVSEALESINNAEKFVYWLKSIGAITTLEQRSKIKAKLSGLSPEKVFELVETI